jgi:hypothetical protein
VLLADAAADPQLAGFAEVREVARALSPQHLIVLSSPGGAVDGAVALGLDPGAPAPGPGRAWTSVVVFPDPGAPSVQEPVRLPCGNAALLLLAGSGLRRDEAHHLDWLAEQTAGGPQSQPLLLFLDEPVWDTLPDVWIRLRGVLGAAARDSVHVVAAGTGRFSWWREDRIEYQALGGTGPARQGERPQAIADGETPGVLWIALGASGPVLRILDPAALLPPAVFSRRLQEERRTLRAACQASPVAAADGVTEVRCQNPTDAPLAFDAEWRFEGVAGRAEPQMLGFALDPGQSFRQRFRLHAEDGVPLKFALPRLALSAVCKDGLGRPVPVRIELRPAVRMGGQIAALGEPVVVNGDIGDWPCAGHPLNHPSQVVLAREAWQGPGELAGTLYAAEAGGTLYLAFAVRRQEGLASGVSVLVDPRGGEGGDYGTSRSPVEISVAPDGRVTVDGSPGEAVTAAWQPNREGGVLEVAVAPGVFAEGRIPDPVLVDAILTRFNVSGEPVSALCFSGDGQGRRSSALYARFARPVVSTPGAPATGPGGRAP